MPGRSAVRAFFLWPLIFTAGLAALTWFLFYSFDLFPSAFILFFSLLTWVRPRLAAPTRFDRIVFSRWSPLAAALLLVLAWAAACGTFDPLPLALALLAFLPLTFDRVRLREALLSNGSLAAFAVLLLAADWAVSGRFEPALALSLFLVGLLVLAPRGELRFPEERRIAALHPALFGILAAIAVGWVWGSLDSVPTIHDEASYLLQASLFAEGRWKAPSPPLPEFFEQFHVLLTPFMASKYPPGHALLLVPGILMGYPALAPLALTGLAGAVFFGLARRLSNIWVAVLAWILWVGAHSNLDYRSTYLSDVTTSALWLVGWWMLLEWKETGRLRYLMALSACIGWGAITRELTTVAFAIPAAVVVLRIAAARRAWRDVVVGAIPGLAILCLLPLSNIRTTGDWRVSPRLLYTSQYMPYDVPGFGPGAPRPTRELPPELRKANENMERHKDTHTISSLPCVLVARARVIANGVFGRYSDSLLPIALVGLVFVTVETVVAIAAAALLVLLYLSYWHIREWSVYYIDLHPVLCFLAALGIWYIVSTLAGLATRHGTGPFSRAASLRSAAALLSAIVLAAESAGVLVRLRADKRAALAPQTEFRSQIRSLRGPSLVFVRYGPAHDFNRSLVENEADLAKSLVWVVHDRGQDNERLRRLVPDRKPYLYEEASRTLLPLSEAHRPTGSGTPAAP